MATASTNPAEYQSQEEVPEEPTLQEDEEHDQESSADESEFPSEGTLDDTTNAPNPGRRTKASTSKKPVGQAKTLPAHKAPLLLKPEGYQTWKTRFLSYCFTFDPKYRWILEVKAIGNLNHEDQLYNALECAVAEVYEARKLVTVLADTSTTTKGSQAWKFLKQRYDRVSESKVQRLLDAHRRGQGNSESMATYLQRYQIQHEELKQLGHPHTERTTASSMVDGLRPEFREIKQYFRIHRKELDNLFEVVETCLELHDCRISEDNDKRAQNLLDKTRTLPGEDSNLGPHSCEAQLLGTKANPGCDTSHQSLTCHEYRTAASPQFQHSPVLVTT